METEFIFGKMEINIKEIGKIINEINKDFSVKLMEINMMEYGKMI